MAYISFNTYQTPHDQKRGSEMNRVNRLNPFLILVVLSVVLSTGVGVALSDVRSYQPITPGELFKKGTQYTESIDMMFDVTQGGALSLGTTNGSVKINTWARSQIRLVITKTTQAKDPYNARTILEDFLVRTLHKGRDLDLQAVAGSQSCLKNVGVMFEVWVPRDYNVDINTGKGNVDIGKISGSFCAKTGNGKISFECEPEGMDIEVEDKSSNKRNGAAALDEPGGRAPEDSGAGDALEGERSGKADGGRL
jgi:hypothetical protein